METITNTRFELLMTLEELRTTKFSDSDHAEVMTLISNGTYTTCEQITSHPVR